MENSTALNVINFKDFCLIEPDQLISFSDNYNKNREDLISFLKQKEGTIINIVIARIEPSGKWGKKEITGTVKDVSGRDFIFISDRDYYGSYGEDRKMLIHFNND